MPSRNEMAAEFSSDCHLWGEYSTPHANSTLNKDVFNNVEQEVILHSLQNITFKKTFCDQEKLQFCRLREGEIRADDPMKQTVKLIKYKNDIRRIVDQNKLQPGLFDVDEQLKNISKPTNGEPKKDGSKIMLFKHVDSDFVCGRYTKPPLDITGESALTVLRNSVMTVLTFVGFTETTILPLQVLTEVTENYIVTLLKLLRLNMEKERIYGETGFCDVIDRTFHEIGIGSVRSLVAYYQENVLKAKAKKSKACCEELVLHENSIQKLREEKKHILESNPLDMEDENLVIPELHVTSMTGNDLLSESFETGLQMLQTLQRQHIKIETNSETFANDVGEMKTLKRKRKL